MVEEVQKLTELIVEVGGRAIKNGSIMRHEIPVGALVEHFSRPQCGGEVLFAGRVRNHTKGRPVEWLEYEAHPELAEIKMREVLSEAVQEFGLVDAFCVHRVGRLLPGQCAVLVVTATAHRDAAFRGNRFIIDEVKKRAPIWKREFFSDGEPQWT